MRAGAREFLSYPFDQSAMAEALVRAAARRPTGRSKRRAGGRQLMFMGTKGGCGVTTIACNYAVALARESGQKTLLIDLDIPLGDAALNLGLTAEYSTVNALQNVKRLDAQFLTQLLVRHESGLYVLVAPGKLPSIQVSHEDVDRLLTVARQEFDNVVVDLGARFDLADPKLLHDATTVYMVTQAGLPELRNANRLITQCFEGNTSNLEVVLNRFEARRIGVTDQQVVKALLSVPKWKIPNDYKAVRRMQSGQVSLDQEESPIYGQLQIMARETCGQPTQQQQSKEKRKKGFNFLRLGKTDKEDGSEDEESVTQLHIGDSEAVELEEAHGVAEEAGVEGSGEQKGYPGEKRIYKGDTYIRGEDGQWYMEEAEASTPEPEAPPAPREKPTLSWEPPEPITYGTRLGSQQFNAVANLPGIYVYTPGENYLLPAGTHTLWVSFMPRDRAASTEEMLQSCVTLVVTKATPSVVWPTPDPISHGTPLSGAQLCASADIPGTFEYSSQVGEVLEEGVHEILAAFVPEDQANYTMAHASVQLQITKPVPEIRWPAPQAIVYGEPLSAQQLNATSTVSGTFTYSIEEHTVLPAGDHLLAVSFTPTDSERYASAQSSVRLHVDKASPFVQWQPGSALTYGEPLSREQLNAIASVAGSMVYTPAEGTVLPAGEHPMTCAFTPEDEANYSRAQATATITVNKATPSVVWKVPEPIDYGTPLSKMQLNAQVTVPGTLMYLPGEGAVLGAGTHSPLVQFVPDDSQNYNRARASITLTVNQARPAIRWDAPVSISYGTPLGKQQLNARASVPGIFSYSPEEGAVLAEGTHRLNAVFVPADAVNYQQSHASTSLQVTKATPATIVWKNPEPITYGTALGAEQLNAEASVPGTFVYTPAAGEVPGAGQHMLHVQFMPDDKNLPPSEADVQLKVAPARPAIHWPQPEALLYGQALSARELNAAANVPGAFAYVPAIGEVLPAGVHQIKAIFTPRDKGNYAVEQATVSLKVARLTPHIQWNTPESVLYGTALSAEQLNAKASVPGSFTYAPSAGTVLAEGTQTLTATFTPEDSANYISTQFSVQIQIRGFSEMENIPMGKLETAVMASTQVDYSAPVEVFTPPVQQAPPAVEVEDFIIRDAPTQQVLETRVYKGAVYEKGADGQWHLQQKK